MDISDANKYAVWGDELRLRREIEFGHRIDERDTTSGRTILADAVAAGNIKNEGEMSSSICMYVFLCVYECMIYV